VPVRADRRTQLPGVVHDTSASGQTIFVEPTEMVELNNRVRELEAAEQHEIDRILAALSAAVALEADRLDATLDAIAAIDLALAKARFASQARLTEPQIVDRAAPYGRRIALRRARHPLLDPATAVPIDLTLGDGFCVLVITGPNTGGKTVALKTVGLLSLMAQAGLFIPADEGSELPVFDGVFADIGDEQSIEQSLSTFSSHTVRVVAALRAITADSLVLFDELGAGTDPEEGAALARAVIERLLESRCLAVGTTHYSELKSFAYATPGVENASVEFDVATLSPTYRLLIGVPGRSNALAIAGRLGMPQAILDRAREFLDPNAEHVDTLLGEIHSRRAAAELAQREAERERADAAQRLAEAEELRANAQRDALAEIEQELYDAREAIRQVRRLPERLPAEEVRPAVEQARRTLDEATGEVREVARRQQVRVPARERLRVGDRVELTTLGGEGEIVGFSEDGLEADLQMGAFKLRQPVRDLKKLERRPDPITRRAAVTMPAPRRRVDMELQLRGHRAGGVETVLEQYLDDASLSNMPFVRIVHGKGTGALREAVQDYLKRSPVVARFETPPHNEGGDGVTVVYLKES
jgi:DNA mismatch repair protein MutS2